MRLHLKCFQFETQKYLVKMTSKKSMKIKVLSNNKTNFVCYSKSKK